MSRKEVGPDERFLGRKRGEDGEEETGQKWTVPGLDKGTFTRTVSIGMTEDEPERNPRPPGIGRSTLDLF